MQNGFREEQVEPRSLERHLAQSNVINGAPQAIKDHYRTAYSIKRKSILTEFSHFDLFKQTPASVMQIL